MWSFGAKAAGHKVLEPWLLGAYYQAGSWSHGCRVADLRFEQAECLHVQMHVRSLALPASCSRACPF